jgi:hypothetical protein
MEQAQDRTAGVSGVARLFETEIARGRFLYHYNQAALAHEHALAGRYVLVTSLSAAQAPTVQVVRAYRQLSDIEHRFRVLKEFWHLRPVRHWTERRVRGHVAICGYASVIEALGATVLRDVDVRDPDLPDQHLTPARALHELDHLRAVTLTAGSHTINVSTRPEIGVPGGSASVHAIPHALT